MTRGIFFLSITHRPSFSCHKKKKIWNTIVSVTRGSRKPCMVKRGTKGPINNTTAMNTSNIFSLHVRSRQYCCQREVKAGNDEGSYNLSDRKQYANIRRADFESRPEIDDFPRVQWWRAPQQLPDRFRGISQISFSRNGITEEQNQQDL